MNSGVHEVVERPLLLARIHVFFNTSLTSSGEEKLAYPDILGESSVARKVLATTNFVSHLILPTNLIPPRRRGGHRGRGTAEDEGSLIMPLSIPLITGPGAITTAITLAYQGDQIDPLIATLIGVGVVAVIIFVSMDYLGGLISEVSDRTMELLLRPGGLVLATLGVQILPGGVMRYFGL